MLKGMASSASPKASAVAPVHVELGPTLLRFLNRARLFKHTSKTFNCCAGRRRSGRTSVVVGVLLEAPLHKVSSSLTAPIRSFVARFTFSGSHCRRGSKGEPLTLGDTMHVFRSNIEQIYGGFPSVDGTPLAAGDLSGWVCAGRACLGGLATWLTPTPHRAQIDRRNDVPRALPVHAGIRTNVQTVLRAKVVQ